MLDDHEVIPGNWWSISREAQAMLGPLSPVYSARLDEETRRVLADPQVSPEDRRWAECYTAGG